MQLPVCANASCSLLTIGMRCSIPAFPAILLVCFNKNFFKFTTVEKII